jgi:hypothetical protein
LFEDDFTFGSLQALLQFQVVELLVKQQLIPMVMGLVKLNLRQLQMMQYPINLFFLMERLQTQVVF